MQSARRWKPGLLAALLLALFLFPSSFALADNPGPEIVRGPSDAPLVALTFDAGDVAGQGERILATLRERGLRVTLFLAGQWLERYPHLAAQVGADGHELANHTYSHPDLRQVSDQRLAWELIHTDELIEAQTGRAPVPYFRPPFGARDARVLRLAGQLGYRSVMWSLDSADWRVEATPDGVTRRVLRLTEAGDVVVMHMASLATAAALPRILDGLADQGLQVVTLSELLYGAAAPPLEPTIQPTDVGAPATFYTEP